jgi:PAS domain S-box-containing protein
VRYIVVPIHALRRASDVPAQAWAPDVPASTPPPAVDAAPAGAEPYGAEPSALPEDALAHWVSAARTSLDACLVVDAGGTVAGLSPTAAELLGTAAAALVGRSLDEAINLVDFTDGAQEARGAARRIPPLIAVRENSLSRGMMRVRRPDGGRLMLDAVAAPIHDTERRPIGAVSFLASV